MAVYPLYTIWMQVVIHYQAFWLWWKQVRCVMMTTMWTTFSFASVGGKLLCTQQLSTTAASKPHHDNFTSVSE